MPTTTSQINPINDEYPSWIGLIFVFNLIVGTGALTLPSVFSRAGWLLGLILICVLAVISYITVTFIIETMACANAIIKWKSLFRMQKNHKKKNHQKSRHHQKTAKLQRRRRMKLKTATLNVAAAAAAAAAATAAASSSSSEPGLGSTLIQSNADRNLNVIGKNPNEKPFEEDKQNLIADEDSDVDDREENDSDIIDVENYINEDEIEPNDDDDDDDDEDDEDDDENYDEFNENIEQTPLFSSSTSAGGASTSRSILIDDDRDDENGISNGRHRYYMLDNKLELGEMADLFLSDFGRILFYLCIAIYLYGDLSIYAAAVAKTIRNIVCYQNQTMSNETNHNSDDDDQLGRLEPCWPGHTLTRFDCYRLALIGFITVMGPFTFFNIQKTKYIQMFTVTLRWLAFSIMIFIAIHRLTIYGRVNNPPMANFDGVPALFGACVYSFMCHHSLPSLLAPIRDKHQLHTLISFDYILICLFYLCLALTGTFAFTHLDDLYTLNFLPGSDTDDPNSVVTPFNWIISYFLILFPVFTLSTSFPIIAITLRNNLQTLFWNKSSSSSSGSGSGGGRGHNEFTATSNLCPRLLFPLLAILPPFAVTYFTDSLSSLVSFTGSYAGTGIQYLIPIVLVWIARSRCTEILGNGIPNEYQSPFQHTGWLLFVFVWSVACLILVTLNFFY